VDTRGLTQYYRKDPPVVVSYSYEDIINGLGYVIFYALKDDEGNCRLIPNQIYSGYKGTEYASTNPTATYNKVGELDFDSSTFNINRKCSGKAFVNVPVGISNINVDHKSYVAVKIYHYDGSTETLIGSGDASGHPLEVTSPDYDEEVQCIACDLTETTFKKGDILRLTVELYSYRGAGSGKVSFGHDPKDSIFEWTGSGEMNYPQLSLHMPFEINTN